MIASPLCSLLRQPIPRCRFCFRPSSCSSRPSYLLIIALSSPASLSSLAFAWLLRSSVIELVTLLHATCLPSLWSVLVRTMRRRVHLIQRGEARIVLKHVHARDCWNSNSESAAAHARGPCVCPRSSASFEPQSASHHASSKSRIECIKVATKHASARGGKATSEHSEEAASERAKKRRRQRGAGGERRWWER